MIRLLVVLVGLSFLLIARSPVRASAHDYTKSSEDISGGRDEPKVYQFASTEATFRGSVTINGLPATGIKPDGSEAPVVVEALVNGKTCSSPGLQAAAGQAQNIYLIVVTSDAIKPGCGKPGDRITFQVFGNLANETAVWQPGSMQILNLTVNSGPASTSPARPPGSGAPPPAFQPPSTGDAGLRGAL